jgi:hypothetical protein
VKWATTERFSPPPAIPNKASRSAASSCARNSTPWADSAALPNNPTPKSTQATDDAILPAADLKPLCDFALDCKACQAKLATSQADLNDEKTKTAALTKERDAAIRAAKGGSALRRVARAAKWFAIGAAAGAVAAEAAR